MTDNRKPNEHVKSRYELWVKVATKKADVKLVAPQLDSLDSVIKKSAGSVLLEVGKGAGKQLLNEDQKKILDSVPNLFKK